MKKKILFVIDSLNCGGAEKSLVSLLPLLSPEKYDISLWILYRGGIFESFLTDNIKIVSAPQYTRFQRIEKRCSLLFYSAVLRLKQILRIHEHHAETFWKCAGWAIKVPEDIYDVAIAYQQGLPTYLVATKINAHKKVAWINADIFSVGYNPFFNAKYYGKYNVLASVSMKLEMILRTHYPQFANLYHCVYDILNPTIIREHASEAIKEKFYFDDTITIVTTGRLVPPKNHVLAVNAARILRDRGYCFKWLFIGDGNERSRIEHLINEYELSDQVFLLGMLSNPYPYMARCDIYVQTSLYEGFGLSIAEAKILGKPVVSTNFDVVHDQLKHGENGLIADMMPESVAANIIRLLENVDFRNHIIANVKKEKNTTYISEVEKVEKILDAD